MDQNVRQATGLAGRLVEHYQIQKHNCTALKVKAMEKTI